MKGSPCIYCLTPTTSHPADKRYLCQACRLKEAEDFTRVVEYVRKNPECRVMDILEDLSVRRESLEYFVQSGKLGSTAPQFICECKYCGALVADHQVCGECRTEIQRKILEVAKGLVDKKKNTHESKFPVFRGSYRLGK